MAYEFRLPDIGEGVAEGELVAWHVKQGDSVAEDQALLEIMTDKVTAEIPSPVSGTIAELKAKVGDVVKVGSVIVVLETGDNGAQPKAAVAEAPKQPPPPVASAPPQPQPPMPQAMPMPEATSTDVLAAPATRRLARELGVDLARVQGSGDHGRVTPEDVQRHAAGGTASSSSAAPRPMRATVATGQDETLPFGGIRKRIAEHLTLSKQKAPHFAYVEELDATELVRLRAQLKDAPVKVSYLPFIMRALVLALAEHPVLNATLDEANSQIIQKKTYNLGVAVDAPQGLIVPVIHGAERYDVLGLAEQVNAVALATREGKLKPEQMQGGTFTVTSIGSIGGLFGVPIINYPEVAILGVNKITPRPVVREGQIVIRDVMYLSLSCDHRVVDGADAARFMNTLVGLLESPARLLL